ncbi:hypothetical protein AJ78_01891 [Emergomyces pasteurianus Ep9510]|uniref:Uncharacterized protein n=1 Tax=Emergomyces pasteurianus Ep9510 TaxID=1447872 RepID=A0A1J9QS28_9EURO|nr:hypothetical protein AJ78_01891 [Emergomyces pasteurianus Ep9510]
MASQSNQGSQADKSDTTTRQTRSQTQKNVKPAAQDFIAKGPQIPEGGLPPKIPREEIDARMKELNK